MPILSSCIIHNDAYIVSDIISHTSIISVSPLLYHTGRKYITVEKILLVIPCLSQLCVHMATKNISSNIGGERYYYCIYRESAVLKSANRESQRKCHFRSWWNRWNSSVCSSLTLLDTIDGLLHDSSTHLSWFATWHSTIDDGKYQDHMLSVITYSKSSNHHTSNTPIIIFVWY